MNLDRVNWNRQTYSLLDWLGDLGGLADALYYGLRALVRIVSVFTFQVKLTSTFFSVKHRSNDSEIEFKATKKGHEQLMTELDGWKKFPKKSFLRIKIFNCWQKHRIERYKKMLDRATNVFNREMDLRLFIPR